MNEAMAYHFAKDLADFTRHRPGVAVRFEYDKHIIGHWQCHMSVTVANEDGTPSRYSMSFFGESPEFAFYGAWPRWDAGVKYQKTWSEYVEERSRAHDRERHNQESASARLASGVVDESEAPGVERPDNSVSGVCGVRGNEATGREDSAAPT